MLEESVTHLESYFSTMNTSNSLWNGGDQRSNANQMDQNSIRQNIAYQLSIPMPISLNSPAGNRNPFNLIINQTENLRLLCQPENWVKLTLKAEILVHARVKKY